MVVYPAASMGAGVGGIEPKPNRGPVWRASQYATLPQPVFNFSKFRKITTKNTKNLFPECHTILLPYRALESNHYICETSGCK